jgi:hypothetical protein
MKKYITLFCLVIASALPLTLAAHSGHKEWGGWKFDWAVEMNSGISLKNVRFNNELVLYRASVPVIRVKYYGGHNDVAYADMINWDNLLDISNCNNTKVCISTYSSGGKQWLEIGVLAAIGKYRLYQVWYLSNAGDIDARLWSKGLHHDDSHTHHAYFRFDFDINGSSNDQVFVRANYYGNEGWGNHWHKYTTEDKDFQDPDANPEQLYFVRDNANAHGVWIVPSQYDGYADQFSSGHIFNRTYKSAEDRSWEFGAWGELEYDNNESIQEKDVVVWYVPHLYHDHSDHGDQWHWAGPRLKVHR